MQTVESQIEECAEPLLWCAPMGIGNGLALTLKKQSGAGGGGAPTNYLLDGSGNILIDGSGNRLTNG